MWAQFWPSRPMTDPSEPILYSFRRCPYAMRARLALAISGTRCVLREVKLSAKPDALIATSPKGTVPVLALHDGRVIEESIEIMRWALSRHDPEDWREHDDVALIERNDGEFKHDLDRYKYPERYGSDSLAHRESAGDYLAALEARLAETNQLSGERRGLTDAAIFPFLRQFAAVDRNWWHTAPFPKLRAWLEGHLASPLFDTVMRRVPPWTPGEPAVFFPAE